jgi:uncharacterized protein (DUF1697 family)
MTDTRWIALLRGINVGGKSRVPMVELRELANQLGWRDVKTYIQSGNLLFRADGDAAAHEAALEAALQAHFGVAYPVIVRTAADWHGYVATNPFPAEAEQTPNYLMLALTKAPPLADAAEALQARGGHGEQVRIAGGALWIYFPNGSGTSKLSPSLMDRLAGSPLTTRNWRTVLAIQALLSQ